MNETPKYVAPQPDPGLAILTEQNAQQQTAAITDRVSAASARLMQQYGTRLATAGSNWSPLIVPEGRGAQLPGMPAPLVIDPAVGAY